MIGVVIVVGVAAVALGLLLGLRGCRSRWLDGPTGRPRP